MMLTYQNGGNTSILGVNFIAMDNEYYINSEGMPVTEVGY